MIERFTEKYNLSIGYYMKCSEDCSREDINCIDCAALENLVDRLGAYEDTGLTPDEVRNAQVRHGRWDDSGRYLFPDGRKAIRCTECGCSLTESEYCENTWNFCPVCGSKMDEG